jgi:pimeloyl-ACP methyl ester carboxylesterase
VIGFLVKPPSSQAGCSTPGVPVYAPIGQIISGFPPELILDSSAVITESYSICYSPSIIQYTVEWNSSHSIDNSQAAYLEYLPANGWPIVGEITTDYPIYLEVSAGNSWSELQIVSSAQPNGSQVIASYGLSGTPPPMDLQAGVGDGLIYLRWGPSSVPVDSYSVEVEKAVDTNSLNIESTIMFVAGVGVTYKAVGTGSCSPPLVGQPASCVITALSAGQTVQNNVCYRLTVQGVYAGVPGAKSQPVVACPAKRAFPAHPDYPILFVHGFNEDGSFSPTGDFWDTLGFMQNTIGWKFGGELYHTGDEITPTKVDINGTCNKTRLNLGLCPSDATLIASADFYTSSFGDNWANYSDLRGLAHQGDEVSSFVATMHADGVTDPITIVSHSNGGLASRYFVTNYKGASQRVARLVTYGTPHRGAAVDEVVASLGIVCTGNILCSRDDAQGALDAKFTCKGNAIVYPGRPADQRFFLKDLDQQALPNQIKYTAALGISQNNWPLPDRRNTEEYPCHSAEWDGLVPESSADLAQAEPAVLQALEPGAIRTITTNKTHLAQTGDFATILCATDPNCAIFQVHSPVDIDVIAPDQTRIGTTFAGIPGASYMNVFAAGGHDTATVLIPFPQGGQYTVKATPKTGALPTDTFSITLTQNGLTTTLANSLQIQSIPPDGFQTHVNSSPTANAGADQTVHWRGPEGAWVTLNGTASTDKDGRRLTFQWTDPKGTVVGTDAVIRIRVPVGTNTYTLRATDSLGLMSTSQTTVTVASVHP